MLMLRFYGSPIRSKLGLSGWVAVAAALSILVAIIAIAFLALGVFVFFLPVLLVAPFMRYFRLKRPHANQQPIKGRPGDVTVIDGAFRVIDTNASEARNGASGDLGSH
jgi:hypothetical protein